MAWSNLSLLFTKERAAMLMLGAEGALVRPAGGYFYFLGPEVSVMSLRAAAVVPSCQPRAVGERSGFLFS